MVGWSLNELAAHVDDIIDGLTIQAINWVFDGGSLRAGAVCARGKRRCFSCLIAGCGALAIRTSRRSPAALWAQNSDSTVQFQPDDSQTPPMRRGGSASAAGYDRADQPEFARGRMLGSGRTDRACPAVVRQQHGQ